MMNILCWITLGIALLSAAPAVAEHATLFASSFAPGDQGAIEAFAFDTKTGELTSVHRNGDIANPFFFAVSPDQKFLYSIHAPTFGGKEPEQIAAYQLKGKPGQLDLLNRQTTRGTASCYVDVDATGKSVLVANYSSGSVISYSVQADGSLSPPVSFVQHQGSSVNPARQKEPHAHCFVISPDNQFAYAADLGIDQIISYSLNPANAQLTANAQPFVRTPPGAGPRHLVFHPNGKWIYVINELLNSVTRFEYQSETGMLIEKQTITTLPKDYTGTTHTADLKITPNGKFLYGTNRGHDSVAAYRIADGGELTLIEIEPSLGKGPQNLVITAEGKWLLCANMPGNNISVFRIGDDGAITPHGTPTEIVMPSCLRLLK